MSRFLLLAVILWISSVVKAESLLSVSSDFSKWYLITDQVKAPGQLPPDQVQEWDSFQIFVDSKNSRVLIAKGYSRAEVETLGRKHEPGATLWKLWIHQAWAAPNCDLQATVEKKTAWAQGLTAESIFSSCEWNPAEIIKDSVNKLIADAKGILSLEVLTKIDQAIETTKFFFQEFKQKVLPGLSKLAEVAPGIASIWACEKIRNQVPALALSAAVPGMALRRIPLVLAESLAEVKFLISDQVVSLVKNIAKAGRLEESAMKIVARLTPHPPDVFSQISVRPLNLEAHASRHARDFSKTGDPTEYYKNLDRFMNKKDPGDIYLKSETVVTKFNPQSGDLLILSPEGRFISYYRAQGRTPEERMEKFINKQAAYERRNKR